MGQEFLDRLALWGTHGLEGCQLVDENSVALVGWYAAGTGVGLVDEPRFFQDSHVVSDGCRRDP